MTVLATETQTGRIYRRTKGPWDGVYYTVPSTVHRGDLIARLRSKAHRKGRDEHLLRSLLRWWVLMRRHRRYRDSQGSRRESTEYAAIPTDYRFREVQSKPGYSRREVNHG